MGNSSQPLPIAIIGGGITGLTAAYRLTQQGRSVRLFEASPRLGGVIHSERHPGGWLIEAGPNSLQETPSVTALLCELGLDAVRLTASPAAKNRYIVRDGRPRPAPASPPAFFTSPLFTFGAKLRLLREFLTPRKTRTDDLSLADFIQAHFGRELVDYGLNPFVSGVYAGDARKLSARHAFPSLWKAEQTHGSLLRAQIAAAKARRARGESAGPPPIVSFPDGLETLPRALAARLPAGCVETGARVHVVIPSSSAAPAGPRFEVLWSQASQAPQTEVFSAVLLALPAGALATLPIGPLGELPLAPLAGVTYPPVSSLFLGYKREQVTHPLDGFGLLVPSVERRAVLGVLFNSTLFPGRAPDGHVGLTVMTGGSQRPELASLEDGPLLSLVREELAWLLGVQGDPVFIRRNVWPRAIPQYNLGHERFLDLMTTVEQAHPGLQIGGNVRDGISLPACLAAGETLAARALARSA